MSRNPKPSLTLQEIEDLKENFRRMPSYTTEGYVRSEDLDNLLSVIGTRYTPQQLEIYKRVIDKCYGGIITLKTFLNTFAKLEDLSTLLPVYAARAYDEDEDGFISKEEFVEYMKFVGIYDPRMEGISYAELIAAADKNRDGKVSVDEFVEWLKK